MTTNILAPGKKVINVDTAAGLRIPHDYYVVGNVVHASSLSPPSTSSSSSTSDTSSGATTAHTDSRDDWDYGDTKVGSRFGPPPYR